MTGLAWWGGADALTFGLVVTVLAVMVWRLADGAGRVRAGRHRGHAGRRLRAVPGRLRGPAGQPGRRRPRVVVTLAAVVLSDTGGYVAGVLFGRHPMAPSVSPKKSWEGLAGSLVATAARRRACCCSCCSTCRCGGALLFGLRRLGRLGRRRPGRVDDQARPRREGHEQPAARPRRAHGPAGLDPVRRADRLPAAVVLARR